MAAVTLLTSSASTTTGNHSATGTPAVGSLIVIFTHDATTNALVAPTDDNPDGLGTYTLLFSAVSASAGVDIISFWARNALIGVSASTVFSHDPGASDGGGIGVHEVTGMTRVGAAAMRQGAKCELITIAKLPFTAFATGAWATNPIICAVYCGTNPPGQAGPTGGYTTRYNDGHALPSRGGQTVSLDSGETRSILGWQSPPGGASSAISIELDASGPANVAWVSA